MTPTQFKSPSSRRQAALTPANSAATFWAMPAARACRSLGTRAGQAVSAFGGITIACVAITVALYALLALTVVAPDFAGAVL